jgi:hypothetical protein
MGVKKRKRNTVKKRKALRKRILRRLPKWQWNPSNGKYEMTEVKDGITYGILLDQMQWLSMMGKCINHLERKEWLSQNNLNPKQIKKYAKTKKLVK